MALVSWEIIHNLTFTRSQRKAISSMRMCSKSRWASVIGCPVLPGKAGVVCSGAGSYLGLPGSVQRHWHMYSGSASLSGCGLGARQHHKPLFNRTFPMATSPVTILNVIEDVRAGP